MDSDRFVKLPWLVATSGKLSFGARLLYAAIQDRSFNGSAVEVGSPRFLESIGITGKSMRRYVKELVGVGLVSVVARGNHVSCKRVVINGVGPDVVKNLHGLDVRESLANRFCRMPSRMVYAKDISFGARIVYSVLVCEGFGKPEAAVTMSDVSKSLGISFSTSKRLFVELRSFGAISRQVQESGRARGLWALSGSAPAKNEPAPPKNDPYKTASAPPKNDPLAPPKSDPLAPPKNDPLNAIPLCTLPNMNIRSLGLEGEIDVGSLSLGNSNSGGIPSIGDISGTEERPSALPPTPQTCQILRLDDFRAVNCTKREEIEMVDTKAAMSVFGRKGGAECDNSPTDEDGDGPVARTRTKKGGGAPRTGSRKGGGMAARTAMVSERMTLASNAVLQPRAEAEVSGDRMAIAHRVFAVWCEEMSRCGYLVPSRLTAWDATKLIWVYDEYIRFGEDYVFRYLRWTIKNWSRIKDELKNLKGESPSVGIFSTGWGEEISQMFYKRWVEQNGVPGKQ